MKKTTVTKYETTDGKSFSDPLAASCHEVSLVINALNDGSKMTAASVIRTIAANPAKVIEALKGLEG